VAIRRLCRPRPAPDAVARHGQRAALTSEHTRDGEGDMAERNRRGEGAADDHLDEVFDDAVDDDAEEPVSRAGGTATRERRRAGATDRRPTRAKRETERAGIFARIGRFVREVVAELRKVIWPTRKELLTYTAVVIVFVSVVLTIVGLLDLAFAKAVLWVFGSKTS
jgi:preprotein translocase subunit SecE